jgi:putative tryptophan/tyrosine transport system substrate-binding protein
LSDADVAYWHDSDLPARPLNVRCRGQLGHSPDSAEWPSLSKIRQDGRDMVLVLSDPFTFTYRKVIVDAAERSRVPSIYQFREYVDDGGLISYGVSIADTYRRAAGYVDKILRGARPADLPVQLPISFELVVNLKTAKLLGLTIPPTLLARADEVIE